MRSDFAVSSGMKGPGEDGEESISARYSVTILAMFVVNVDIPSSRHVCRHSNSRKFNTEICNGSMPNDI